MDISRGSRTESESNRYQYHKALVFKALEIAKADGLIRNEKQIEVNLTNAQNAQEVKNIFNRNFSDQVIEQAIRAIDATLFQIVPNIEKLQSGTRLTGLDFSNFVPGIYKLKNTAMRAIFIAIYPTSNATVVFSKNENIAAFLKQQEKNLGLKTIDQEIDLRTIAFKQKN